MKTEGVKARINPLVLEWNCLPEMFGTKVSGFGILA
jgi:hypothetical protein